MESPFAFQPDKPITRIGHAFGTPLAVQGASWLPLSELAVWAIFTWQSVKKRPSWSGLQHLALGGMRMVVFLGSEWCHNLAHVFAARLVGKPVDVVRILLGMPVLIYHEPEHPSVTPSQHITRSLGGPICNSVLLVLSKIFQRMTRRNSPAREIVDTAVGMNAFIASAGLLPIPAFDGGPVLKWSLIRRGVSPGRATALTNRAAQMVGAGLLGSSAVAVGKRRWFPALVLSLLGVLSLISVAGNKKD